MHKRIKLSTNKQAKVLSFLQNHPNEVLSKHAQSIIGGADPVLFAKGLNGRMSPPGSVCKDEPTPVPVDTPTPIISGN
jgi:hypothetical protein